MERYGISRTPDKNENLEHLSVLNYKKQERIREVEELIEQAETLEQSNTEAQRETDEIQKSLEKMKSELSELTEDKNEIDLEYCKYFGDSWELPEPSALMSAKTFRSKYARVTVNGDVIEKAPKSDAGIRDIWLGDEALKIFIDEHNKYLAETKKVGFKATDYVIHTKNGEAYAPDSISQKWERFRNSNNLPKIRFHDLRHTCATMMIAAGVDPKTVQTRLGHSDVQITLNTYSHCLPSMNKAAGNTMDMLFK